MGGEFTMIYGSYFPKQINQSMFDLLVNSLFLWSSIHLLFFTVIIRNLRFSPLWFDESRIVGYSIQKQINH